VANHILKNHAQLKATIKCTNVNATNHILNKSSTTESDY